MLCQTKEYLESLNPGETKFLEKYMIGWQKVHTWEPSSFLKQVKDDRLLLTVNPRLTNCPSEYKDDLVFAKRFWEHDINLAYTWNSIKEEFSTARHLYYQSFSQDKELIEVSEITEYIDTLDSANFGLRSGFLKTSLRLAVDLLDKFAGFFNLYLELGNDPTKVMWSNVWYEKLKYKKSFDNSLNPIIFEKLEYNPYLKALVNLRKNLYDKKYEDFYPFKILRDYITHQGIILHNNKVIDESKENYNLEQMQQETYFLLRMVKAAIIYLVGVVMIEEEEKEKRLII
ncbi:LA2681 family HEPN domain-containing protein [Crocosphaera chwakensis]|uniref:LA2681 family HEPN domain-containing protein n=1 Tax=Crocosphaera chwakensis TaxID=2546361 RepID=UPI0012F7423D|nr:LA2681 family HEPN domain-containing protein [Crocosphaera chwakensis]